MDRLAPDNLCKLLRQVVPLAEEAGRRIMAVYSTDFSVEHKDDASPLTAADIAAHDVIMASLQKFLPDIPVLSEEEADIPFEVRSHWQCYWLVDPLDGTREFIKRNGEFTVNIALIDQGRPILGVIYVPVSGVTYFACHGHGAFKHEPGLERQAIHVCEQRRERVVVAGSRSHRGKSLERFLAKIGEYEIISMGSSLKSCLVAEGRADIYARLGPTSEWDTAAAQCIVEEAGGSMTDINLQPLRYNTKKSLLNPYFLVFGDKDHDWRQYL